MPVADPPHSRQVTPRGRDAAQGRAGDGLDQHRRHRLGAELLEGGFQVLEVGLEELGFLFF